MEDRIKDFDRSIEQAMNEASVTPPFGMWNRISAELEVAPTPAPTSWTAGTLVPKAAIVGLVALALIETSLLVAFMYKTPASKLISTENIVAQPVHRNLIAIPEVKQEQIAALPEKEATVTLSRKARVAHVSISKPTENNVAGVTETQPELTAIAANSEVAVPMQATKSDNGIGMATNGYYFPPVDADRPEPKAIEIDVKTTTVAKPNDDDEAAADKKMKLAPEKKIHIKHKHHAWNPGRMSFPNK